MSNFHFGNLQRIQFYFADGTPLKTSYEYQLFTLFYLLTFPHFLLQTGTEAKFFLQDTPSLRVGRGRIIGMGIDGPMDDSGSLYPFPPQVRGIVKT